MQVPKANKNANKKIHIFLSSSKEQCMEKILAHNLLEFCFGMEIYRVYKYIYQRSCNSNKYLATVVV